MSTTMKGRREVKIDVMWIMDGRLVIMPAIVSEFLSLNELAV